MVGRQATCESNPSAHCYLVPCGGRGTKHGKQFYATKDEEKLCREAEICQSRLAAVKITALADMLGR
ncbi:hypothetical protein VTI28DRAFT_10630 [Corynascus sepedonium]